MNRNEEGSSSINTSGDHYEGATPRDKMESTGCCDLRRLSLLITRHILSGLKQSSKLHISYRRSLGKIMDNGFLQELTAFCLDGEKLNERIC